MFLFTRGTPNEKDFMRKQQLIDAADASGLSDAPVAYESIPFPISNLLILYPLIAV